MLKMIKKLFFINFIVLFSSSIFAIDYPTINPVPGGIAVVNLDAPFNNLTKVFFNKKRVLVKQSDNGWQAFIGLPLKIKAGKHHVDIIDSKGKKIQKHFFVAKKDYETRHITINNKRMVSPTKKDIERHYKEKPLMLAALKKWTDNNNIQTNFIAPVDGRFSSIFGLKRIYNKQARIRRHTGLDIAAPQGTNIKSPAKGTVIRTGSYFFTGNTVFIDHGQGLVTMYCHLNKTHVKAGQQLVQGESIGTVGMTGRVSGPHLHWVVSLNNTKVDPKLFISQNVTKK